MRGNMNYCFIFFFSLLFIIINVGYIQSVFGHSQNQTSLLGDNSTNETARLHLPQECGITRLDNKTKRIIDGDKAALGQFPWMARIGITNRQSLAVTFFCGASIINRYYLITAAHCNEYPGDVVRVGENYLKTDVDCDDFGDCAPRHQDIKIKSIINNHFCMSNFMNDYALVELESPIQFNDYVGPICLPKGRLNNKELKEEPMTIAGWGLTQSKPRVFAKHLMYIKAPLLEDEECNKVYALKLGPEQLCIGYPLGKDSCNGDSGGPVVKTMMDNGIRRAYLIGLVSFGLPVCGGGPAVYTDVSLFLTWTLDRINKH